MNKKADSEQEPSIEEILDSIRQIISDDEEAPGGPDSPPASAGVAPAARDAADDDFVMLRDKVEEGREAAVSLSQPAAKPAPAIEVDMQDAAPPPPPPPRQAAPAPASAQPVELETIMTQRAEAATMEAFTSLAKRAALERASHVTVEDVVRQELRPLLQTWLDSNLPAMVERLVQKELERISSAITGD